MKTISPAHQKPEDMPRTFRFEHELETQGGVQRTAAPYQYTKIYISLLTAHCSQFAWGPKKISWGTNGDLISSEMGTQW